MPRFFLHRPVLSVVISLIIVLTGLVSLKKLPIEQYPSLNPVQILVKAQFPGASAETMAQTVAAPLEQAVNGLKDMIYMYSQCTAPGYLEFVISFKVGSDPDLALINTQTRINLALSSLPIEVQRQGVAVLNQYTNVLLFISIGSESEAYDDIFIANFATTNVANHLDRISGVGSARILNARNYSMRIWINPDKLTQFSLTPSDVVSAVREQSGARSIGLIGQEPQEMENQLTIPVNGRGRLKTPKEFGEVILKANQDGSMVLLKDVSRVELGALSYAISGKLNGKKSTLIGIYQEPGANAIDVADRVKKKMDELSLFFPAGITYNIPYDTTNFIELSIREIEKTLFEAALLVSFVIFLFLHSVRASLIPITAMIVSISGAFIGMYFLGFSINTLTLFGLVLCVGIVVDDAIIVVENVERKIREENLSAKEAAEKAMGEIVSPVIATSFVLFAVFIPVSLLGGIPGQFYKQFAITIAVSSLLSGFIALTLSPVLCSLLLKKPKKPNKFSVWFDQFFEKFTGIYIEGARWFLKRPMIAGGGFVALLIAIAFLAIKTPSIFVPKEDQGVILALGDLPDGASLRRVEKVSSEVTEETLLNKDVEKVLSFSGYDILQSIQKTNMGAYYIKLKDWKERKAKKQSSFAIIDELNQKFSQNPEANITVFSPPDIPGVGVIGGFDFWIVDEGGSSYSDLNRVVDQIIEKARKRPEFSKVLTSMDAHGLELFIDIDTIKARALGVRIDKIYEALQVLMGSLYINQFNKQDRVYQVIAQAEPKYRDAIDDIGDIYVRSEKGQMVPLKSLVIPKFKSGPTLYQRFNSSPAGLISVIPSIADPKKVISIMEEIAQEFLLPQMSYAWGGLAFQEKQEGGISYIPILFSLILVFLVLAALYERWTLPIAILMSVPFAFLGALLSINIRGIPADIFFQVGIITLIGLAAKNAILIVEFAKEKRKEEKDIDQAVLEASRLRFRAIIMTSLTMIIGAVPLVFVSGPGAASRASAGTGVMGGMIAATFLGVFFVPLFFKVIEHFSDWLKKGKNESNLE